MKMKVERENEELSRSADSKMQRWNSHAVPSALCHELHHEFVWLVPITERLVPLAHFGSSA